MPTTETTMIAVLRRLAGFTVRLEDEGPRGARFVGEIRFGLYRFHLAIDAAEPTRDGYALDGAEQHLAECALLTVRDLHRCTSEVLAELNGNVPHRIEHRSVGARPGFRSIMAAIDELNARGIQSPRLRLVLTRDTLHDLQAVARASSAFQRLQVNQILGIEHHIDPAMPRGSWVLEVHC